MIQLTHSALDPEALRQAACVPAAGAVVVFLGITREYTDGQQTRFLEYDAYEPMAEKVMSALETEARNRWPLVTCTLVHRLGRVDLSEVSVAVVVSAAHRGPAFEAARWLIDELKVRVPIWKKEHGPDGASLWIHPNGERRQGVPHD